MSELKSETFDEEEAAIQEARRQLLYGSPAKLFYKRPRVLLDSPHSPGSDRDLILTEYVDTIDGSRRASFPYEFESLRNTLDSVEDKKQRELEASRKRIIRSLKERVKAQKEEKMSPSKQAMQRHQALKKVVEEQKQIIEKASLKQAKSSTLPQLEDLFEEDIHLRRKERLLQQITFQRTVEAQVRAQRRASLELQRKKKQEKIDRDHANDLVNLKRMRITQNIMESACRIGGFSYEDFVKIERYLATLSPTERKRYEEDWLKKWSMITSRRIPSVPSTPRKVKVKSQTKGFQSRAKPKSSPTKDNNNDNSNKTPTNIKSSESKPKKDKSTKRTVTSPLKSTHKDSSTAPVSTNNKEAKSKVKTSPKKLKKASKNSKQRKSIDSSTLINKNSPQTDKSRVDKSITNPSTTPSTRTRKKKIPSLNMKKVETVQQAIQQLQVEDDEEGDELEGDEVEEGEEEVYPFEDNVTSPMSSEKANYDITPWNVPDTP